MYCDFQRDAFRAVLTASRYSSAARISGEAKDNSFSSGDLRAAQSDRQGGITPRCGRNAAAERCEGMGDTDKEFSVRGSRGGGLSFLKESRSSTLEWGRIAPRDSQGDPGRRARYIRCA